MLLTKEEKKKRELRQQILEMAKDRNRFNYKDDGYMMPDTYEDEHGKLDRAKRDSVLTARYQDEEQVKTEQEIWEEEQSKLGKVGFGAKDRKTRQEDEQYALIMDNQIDFISQEILKGTLKDKSNVGKKADEDSDEESFAEEKEHIMTEHEKILIGRKKLPVFPYREEFLQAVRDNKVLIVVGETGSGKISSLSLLVSLLV